ncbi:dihydroneopterin aldolase [Weeksellaceae bacterium TAE3-ERU29]|nr:dihydroneopterin aldolase [Weeksellaceae bacterium TAE3-ERU29]
MQQILLENIKIYAFHGCLPEENIIGSWYLIDLCVEADLEKAGETDCLNYTINYATLSEIIHNRMAKKSNLLETVCYDILNEIGNVSDLIHSAKIKVSKISPPMPGNIEKASVVFSKKYK